MAASNFYWVPGCKSCSTCDWSVGPPIESYRFLVWFHRLTLATRNREPMSMEKHVFCVCVPSNSLNRSGTTSFKTPPFFGSSKWNILSSCFLSILKLRPCLCYQWIFASESQSIPDYLSTRFFPYHIFLLRGYPDPPQQKTT